MRVLRISAGVAFVAAGLAATSAHAQDSLATLRIRVMAGSEVVVGAAVRAGALTRNTDALGIASFRLRPGHHVVSVVRLGFVPDTVSIELRARMDTLLVVDLSPTASELERIVVAATRGERRVEDTPVRVEIIDDEEVAEKVAMTPGDITMMLNETSGLRVQTTSAALGGANVRVHGLRGRYTLVLTDGLPLYGAQAGGLGLLQIPPLDLARVEVIKGTASALYGGSALGGVVNLISRRPQVAGVREVLLNQTTRGGTDAVLFLASASSTPSPWGATVLASGHTQHRNDLDADGWADMAGYDRITLRPRLLYENANGSLLLTAGLTSENRSGGTLPGRVMPDGSPHIEELDTRRGDVGVVARRLLGGRDILSLRASAMQQKHRHQFGQVSERDRHRSAMSEITLAMPRAPLTYVIGAAFAAEDYRNSDVLAGAFDYSYKVPSLLAQTDIDFTTWLTVSASGRLDSHNVYGTTVSPRLSILLRPHEKLPGDWAIRLSGGGGTFAPVPFSDETDAIGLTPVRPASGLEQERALYIAGDLNGSLQTRLGTLELGGTLHRSLVRHPLALRDAATGVPRVEFVNAPLEARAWGAELLTRVVRAPARLTLTYAYLNATEWDPRLGNSARRLVPLSPRHTAGAVASVEREENYRLGVEVYYTGRQALEHNPFRSTSAPYVIFGLLGERWVQTRPGLARFFLNLENLGNVRQTRYDPLLLPFPGEGGRRTTDVWTELSGFTANAGVRFAFGR
jgi:iron complex outermembrane receptor protein